MSISKACITKYDYLKNVLGDITYQRVKGDLFVLAERWGSSSYDAIMSKIGDVLLETVEREKVLNDASAMYTYKNKDYNLTDLMSFMKVSDEGKFKEKYAKGYPLDCIFLMLGSPKASIPKYSLFGHKFDKLSDVSGENNKKDYDCLRFLYSLNVKLEDIILAMVMGYELPSSLTDKVVIKYKEGKVEMFARAEDSKKLSRESKREEVSKTAYTEKCRRLIQTNILRDYGISYNSVKTELENGTRLEDIIISRNRYGGFHTAFGITAKLDDFSSLTGVPLNDLFNDLVEGVEKDVDLKSVLKERQKNS